MRGVHVIRPSTLHFGTPWVPPAWKQQQWPHAQPVPRRLLHLAAVGRGALSVVVGRADQAVPDALVEGEPGGVVASARRGVAIPAVPRGAWRGIQNLTLAPCFKCMLGKRFCAGATTGPRAALRMVIRVKCRHWGADPTHMGTPSPPPPHPHGMRTNRQPSLEKSALIHIILALHAPRALAPYLQNFCPSPLVPVHLPLTILPQKHLQQEIKGHSWILSLSLCVVATCGREGAAGSVQYAAGGHAGVAQPDVFSGVDWHAAGRTQRTFRW